MKLSIRSVIRGAVVAGAAAVLAACNPAPGEADLTITGAVEAEISGPTAQCLDPANPVDAYSLWEWTGTLDGRPASVTFAGLVTPTIDSAVAFLHGEYYYARVDSDQGDIDVLAIDDDGTLHVQATLEQYLPGDADSPSIEVAGALRCP